MTKKLEVYLHYQDGKEVMSPEQKVQEKRYLSTFKPSDVIKKTLEKYHQPKSNKQLKTWWGLFCKIVLAEFNDRGKDTGDVFNIDKPTGIEISKELLKDWMYILCPTYDDEGHRVTMSDMNTMQMAKFFDDCRKFASSQWSIYIPEPDKEWHEKEGEK